MLLISDLESNIIKEKKIKHCLSLSLSSNIMYYKMYIYMYQYSM